MIRRMDSARLVLSTNEKNPLAFGTHSTLVSSINHSFNTYTADCRVEDHKSQGVTNPMMAMMMGNPMMAMMMGGQGPAFFCWRSRWLALRSQANRPLR